MIFPERQIKPLNLYLSPMERYITLSVTNLIIFLVIGLTGIVSVLSVSHSVGAWHARFKSREECMYYYKIENLNTTGEAARICDKIIPHTNVTISIYNNTSLVPLENK